MNNVQQSGITPELAACSSWEECENCSGAAALDARLSTQSRRPGGACKLALSGCQFDADNHSSLFNASVREIVRRGSFQVPLTRSQYRSQVLDIQTEASVVLAARKIRLDEVLALSTGSMLAFDKSCDEPLVLQIGAQHIALGDAVKVGDKFGIRIRQTVAEMNAK